MATCPLFPVSLSAVLAPSSNIPSSASLPFSLLLSHLSLLASLFGYIVSSRQTWENRVHHPVRLQEIAAHCLPRNAASHTMWCQLVFSMDRSTGWIKRKWLFKLGFISFKALQWMTCMKHNRLDYSSIHSGFSAFYGVYDELRNFSGDS